MPEAQLVVVVGPCGSGKSTVVDLLRDRGIWAREVGQEHTDMPYYWRLPGPGILVYLDLELEGVRRRKNSPAWPEDRLALQVRRLSYARSRADIYIDTGALTALEVVSSICEALPARDPGPPDLNVPGDFESLTGAVEAASDGQTIVLGQGIHRENVLVRDRNLTIRSGRPGEPGVVGATVIDGGGRGCTLTVDGGRVSVMGLTITGGHGGIYPGGFSGGGVTVTGGAEATISGCIVHGNVSDGDGGGILVRDALAIIRGNDITHNRASGEGGGLALVRDTPVAVDAPDMDLTEPASLSDGIDAGAGGEAPEALRGDGEIPVVKGREVPPVGVIVSNRVASNRALGTGGGIYVGGVSPRIELNTIEDNRAERGGGIYVDDNSRPSITRNAVTRNDARLEGGGVSVGWGSSPSLDDNRVTDNRAGAGGGVFVWERASPRLVKNRLVRNESGSGPGLVLAPRSHADTVSNTVSSGEAGQT